MLRVQACTDARAFRAPQRWAQADVRVALQTSRTSSEPLSEACFLRRCVWLDAACRCTPLHEQMWPRLSRQVRHTTPVRGRLAPPDFPPPASPPASSPDARGGGGWARGRRSPRSRETKTRFIEAFEDEDHLYLIYEKAGQKTLFEHIQADDTDSDYDDSNHAKKMLCQKYVG